MGSPHPPAAKESLVCRVLLDIGGFALLGGVAVMLVLYKSRPDMAERQRRLRRLANFTTNGGSVSFAFQHNIVPQPDPNLDIVV